MKVAQYSRCLTRKYRCHISMEQTQGGGAIAGLIKYAFKPPSVQYLHLSTRQESKANRTTRHSSKRSNPARANICNAFRLYK